MSDAPVQVCIIGSGLSGICLALDLQRKGFQDFIIYDRDDAVGGTWNNNRYPGCRCDVSAVVYSHSRHLNPNWTETHPPRAEILEYWQKLARDQGLMPKIKLGHTYVKGIWDSESASWDVTLKGPSGEFTVRHKILVSAIGGFSEPLMPDCPGLDTYKGQVLHTLTWPRDLEVKHFKGKEVMVVGNGCSGVQLVTALAQDPDVKVIAMSRSHQWLSPSPTRQGPHSTPYTPRETFLHSIPFFLWLIRLINWVKMELSYAIFLPSFPSIGKNVSTRLAGWMRKRAPPGYKDTIVPPFRLGAKRIVMDGGYLDALNKPNVTPSWDKLVSATPDEVVTASGKTYSPDVIALATGFDVKVALDITGRDGHAIHSDRSHATGYHASVMPGFPNFFQMLGANSAPVLFSVAFFLEVQANYISDCVVAMSKHKINALEVKQSACEKYNVWLDKRIAEGPWATAKHYFRADGGTGRVYTHFPGPATLFWWINRNVKWDDFIGAEEVARHERNKRRAVAAGVVAIASAVMWRWVA